MDSDYTTISRFKAQVNKFSGILSKDFTVAKQRLVKHLIYGIQAAKDVKLSNIGRALQEDIPLIKTEDRLSRNLNDVDMSQSLNNTILRLASNKIHEGMVIAIDPGDIMKPYATEMENLCNIYDGSEGEKAKGYHLCQVTAANLAHDTVVPLYCEAYSSDEKNYTTSTDKIKSIITHVKSVIGSEGTWAIDRQGDNQHIIKHFLDEGLQFVTRLKLNRYLHKNYNTVAQVQADHIDRFIEHWHKASYIKIKDGKEELVNVQFGSITIALPDLPDKWFNLIVVKGWGTHPVLLLTNLELNKQDSKALWQVVEIYLTRWKCDECFRYIKQSYNLEDIRVLSYISIRNIVAIVHAIAYFTSIYMGQSLKLKCMVQKIFILSKRLFAIPVFFNYAMTDGIFELLKKTRKGIDNFKGKTGSSYKDYQLSLGFD